MADFPEEIRANIVDDVFDHYTLLFERGTDDVYVYCEWCDGIVCAASYSETATFSELEFYSYILDEHRKI